jgi:hypothetical protein
LQVANFNLGSGAFGEASAFTSCGHVVDDGFGGSGPRLCETANTGREQPQQILDNGSGSPLLLERFVRRVISPSPVAS